MNYLETYTCYVEPLNPSRSLARGNS